MSAPTKKKKKKAKKPTFSKKLETWEESEKEMLTQSNTTAYVNLDKAITELKKPDKPSAKTDIQIFKCMANWANQDGTVDMRTSGIADTVGVRLSTVVNSAHRLEKKGFIRIGKEPTPEGHGNILPRNVYTITPKYLRKNTAPAVQLIDGKPCVRVVDLAHLWDTTTSNILACCKPHHVPEEYLKRIDGRVWCELAGLRYRLTATKSESRLTRHIREFLEAQAVKPTEAATEPTTSEPTATDLGTAALIADARRTAAQALAQANDNTHRLDAQARVIHDLQATATAGNAETYAAKEKAAQAVSVSHASRNRARNNAQRLTRQSEKLQALENDSYRRFDTVMTRCHRIERRQGDNAIELTNVKQDVRFLKLTAVMFAILHVVGGIVRMARRR